MHISVDELTTLVDQLYENGVADGKKAVEEKPKEEPIIQTPIKTKAPGVTPYIPGYTYSGEPAWDSEGWIDMPEDTIALNLSSEFPPCILTGRFGAAADETSKYYLFRENHNDS